MVRAMGVFFARPTTPNELEMTIKVSVDGLQTPLCERGVAKDELAGALESMGSALSALEKLREG